MKRKYPLSFFLLGVLQNLIRYFLIGLIGFVFIIIGVIGVPICNIIGMMVLAGYLLLSIIEQLFIRSSILKESDNHEFNQFMDAAFGINNNDEKSHFPYERTVKIVEDKIKSQDTDL